MAVRVPDPRDGLEPAVCLDVEGFAAAVADLMGETGRAWEHVGPAGAQAVLTHRLGDPEFASVLAATPAGFDATVEEVLRELRGRPSLREATHNPPVAARQRLALVCTRLLSQVDVVWWGATPPFATDADLLHHRDLVDLATLRRQGQLRFRYRMQATNLPTRVTHGLARRVLRARRPRVAGLRFRQSRPEMVRLLGEIADDFAWRAPAGTPPLWVTSLARSVEHQLRLITLGYPAVLPSAHCSGYAADVVMTWYRRFGGADRALADVLRERRAAGELNVIDEGQVWHICPHPDAMAARRDPRRPGRSAGVASTAIGD